MKTFTIDRLNAGKRIFRFIKSVLPDAKNSEIFKMLRKKVICVNKLKVIPEYVLEEGDLVMFYVSESHFKTRTIGQKSSAKSKNLTIIYEDPSLMILNKPRGVLVHPGKNKKTFSIIDWIKSYLYEKGEYSYSDTFSPALCNRLDVYTTGILVAAKSHNALKEITGLFRERKVDKQYLGICYGPLEKVCIITSEIEDKSTNNMVQNNKLKVVMLPPDSIPDKESFLEKNQNVSVTLIEPLVVSKECSLVKIDLWTGKKHQIRVHLNGINHPLVGDRKYFTPKSSRFSVKHSITHYFLHAYKLRFDDSRLFTAAVPSDFKKEIRRLFNNSKIELPF